MASLSDLLPIDLPSNNNLANYDYYNKMKLIDLTEYKIYDKLFKDEPVNKSIYASPNATKMYKAPHPSINSITTNSLKLNNNLKNNNIQISILSLNIRSLENKIDSLIILLNNIDIPFDVIALNETWLSSKSVSNVDLPNYSFVAKNREKKEAVVWLLTSQPNTTILNVLTYI